MQTLNVFKLNKEATLPTRTNPTDAGLDIFSSETVFIPVGATVVVKTGIAIQTPEGMIAKIEDRSGLASKGLRTGAGVVDAGFSGEVGVVMHNFSATHHSMNMVRGHAIQKGDKIAQVVLYNIHTPAVNEVSELWTSERGTNGFGASDNGQQEKTTGRFGYFKK
jgi:dUTP pyrophosphatase